MTADSEAVKVVGRDRYGWRMLPWLALLGVCYLAVHAPLAANTWDDMAITLGFARTFAESGRIAPTPLSDVVEGYSSTFWMLFNAALYELDPDPDALMRRARAFGAVFLLASMVLLYWVARRQLELEWQALAVALAAGLSSTALMESISGMENPIWLLLLLVAVLSYDPRRGSAPRSLLFAVSTALFLLVRWEALWYLLPFFVHRIRARGWRGLFAGVHFLWLAVFGFMEVWRWTYFGEWVPNTILAKAGAPYSWSGPFMIARDRMELVVEAGGIFLPLLLAVGFCCLAATVARRTGRVPEAPNTSATGMRATVTDRVAERQRFVMFGVVLCALVFNLAIGTSWGYPGRMYFLAVPFGILLLTRRAATACPGTGTLRAVVVALALASLAVGGVRQAVIRQLGRSPVGRITVSNIAMVVPALDRIRDATRKDQLVFASPDMGGLLLYGRGLRVVDLGRLCNKHLAHHRYGDLGSYLFDQETPDVIEIHGVWTGLSGIGESPRLYSDYSVLFVDGIRFFIHTPALARIPPPRLRVAAFGTDGDTADYDVTKIWTVHRSPVDLEVNRRFGHYRVLRPADEVVAASHLDRPATQLFSVDKKHHAR